MASGGAIVRAVHFGFGQHLAVILKHHGPRGMAYFSNVVMWYWISTPLASASFYMSKLSIAFFLLRLVPHRKTAKLIWAVVGLLTLAEIYHQVTLTGGCRPFNTKWTFDPKGKCWQGSVVITGPYVWNGQDLSSAILFNRV